MGLLFGNRWELNYSLRFPKAWNENGNEVMGMGTGASIPWGGLEEQSPTFLKVGLSGGLKEWLFQLICGAWIIRQLRENR